MAHDPKKDALCGTYGTITANCCQYHTFVVPRSRRPEHVSILCGHVPACIVVKDPLRANDVFDIHPVSPEGANSVYEAPRADPYQSKLDFAGQLKVWWVEEGSSKPHAALMSLKAQDRTPLDSENAAELQAGPAIRGDRDSSASASQTHLPHDVVETLGKPQEITQMLQTQNISGLALDSATGVRYEYKVQTAPYSLLPQCHPRMSNGRSPRRCDASYATAAAAPRPARHCFFGECNAETLRSGSSYDNMEGRVEAVKPKNQRSPLERSIQDDLEALHPIEEETTPFGATRTSDSEILNLCGGKVRPLSYKFGGERIQKNRDVVDMKEIEAAENVNLSLENRLQQIEIDVLEERLHRAQENAHSFICGDLHEDAQAPPNTASTSSQNGLHAQNVVLSLHGGGGEEESQKDEDAQGQSQTCSGNSECEAESSDVDKPTPCATLSTVFVPEDKKISFRQALEARVLRPTARTVEDDTSNATTGPNVTVLRERNRREESGTRACETRLSYERWRFEDSGHNLKAELSAKRAESSSRLEIILRQKETIDDQNHKKRRLGRTIDRQDDEIDRLNKALQLTQNKLTIVKRQLGQERDKHDYDNMERNARVHICRSKPEPRPAAKEHVVTAPTQIKVTALPSSLYGEPRGVVECNCTMRSTEELLPDDQQLLAARGQPFIAKKVAAYISKKVGKPLVIRNVDCNSNEGDQEIKPIAVLYSSTNQCLGRLGHLSTVTPDILDSLESRDFEMRLRGGASTPSPSLENQQPRDQLLYPTIPSLCSWASEDDRRYEQDRKDHLWARHYNVPVEVWRRALQTYRDSVGSILITYAMEHAMLEYMTADSSPYRRNAGQSANQYMTRKPGASFRDDDATTSTSQVRTTAARTVSLDDVEQSRGYRNVPSQQRRPMNQNFALSAEPPCTAPRADFNPQENLDGLLMSEVNPREDCDDWHNWMNGYVKQTQMSLKRGAYYPDEESVGSARLSLRGGGRVNSDLQEQLADSPHVTQHLRPRYRVRQRQQERDWSRTFIEEQLGMIEAFETISVGRAAASPSDNGVRRDDQKRAARKTQHQKSEQENRRPQDEDGADMVLAGSDNEYDYFEEEAERWDGRGEQ